MDSSALEAALTETGVGGCNEGLLRADATLNLVLVSDEEEQSEQDPSHYLSLFEAWAGSARSLRVHAIGGDPYSGCGTAEPYDRAYEATEATGGTFLSLCATDWSGHVERLAEAFELELEVFALSSVPLRETLRVTVDSAPQATGWDYDADDNAVVFESGQVPPGGARR